MRATRVITCWILQKRCRHAHLAAVQPWAPNKHPPCHDRCCAMSVGRQLFESPFHLRHELKIAPKWHQGLNLKFPNLDGSGKDNLNNILHISVRGWIKLVCQFEESILYWKWLPTEKYLGVFQEDWRHFMKTGDWFHIYFFVLFRMSSRGKNIKHSIRSILINDNKFFAGTILQENTNFAMFEFQRVLCLGIQPLPTYARNLLQKCLSCSEISCMLNGVTVRTFLYFPCYLWTESRCAQPFLFLPSDIQSQ
jgi:hypothetical protein